MPWVTMSATLPRVRARTCQLLTTATRKGSVFGQALWSDREATRSGYLAANHIPTAASERHARDVGPVPRPPSLRRPVAEFRTGKGGMSRTHGVEDAAWRGRTEDAKQRGPASIDVMPLPQVTHCF